MSVENEHVWLSDILKLTLDKNEHDKFFLSHWHELLNSNNQECDLKLSKDVIDTAMMERLGLVDVHDKEAYQKPNCSIRGLLYLFGIYENILNFREKNAVSMVHKTCYSEEQLSYCQDLIVQYSTTCLIEQDIFLYGDNNWFYMNTILEKPHSVAYLRDIRKSLNESLVLSNIFGCVLVELQRKLNNESIARNVLDNFYLHAADIVLLYTEDEATMEVLTNPVNWFGACRPNAPMNGMKIETTTIMGQILQASVFTRSRDSLNIHFPSQNNFREINDITPRLREQINKLLTKCSIIFKRLLAKKKFYNKVLVWFLVAAHGNIKRRQLGELLSRSQISPYSSPGFSINVVYLALMIFEPMTNDYNKFCDRMDFTYCIKKHIYDGGEYFSKFEVCLAEESTMLPRNKQIQERILNNNLNENVKSKGPSTFFTEWGFLCSRLIQAMYIPIYNDFINGLKFYHENNDNLNDRERARFLGGHFSRTTVLNDPALEQLLIKYCAAFSVFILEKINFHIIPSLQPYGYGYGYNSSSPKIQTHFKITKDKQQAPDITYCMPDSFVEDIGTVTEMFNNEYSTDFDDYIQPIIIFLSTMMGNTYLIQNPHRRAQMAKVLAYLNRVPMLGSMGSNKISLIERTLDTKSPASELLVKIFPKNLIRIFIDIEFTGSAGAFYQKFSYRNDMYALIKLIVRTLPLLKRLEEIGRKSEKSDVHELQLFLRFVNLLTNDSTYLLDEALSYIAKIKDIETLKDSNEWIQLSLEEKDIKQKELDSTIERAVGFNTMSLETVKAIKRITTHIRGPFLTLAMKDKFAAMLNYFYFQLVSNKQSNLKVRNMNDIKFDPKKLLKNISIIYANFANEPVFAEAVAKDERSFSLALFPKAISILKKVNCPYDLIKCIESIGTKSREVYLLNLTTDLDLSDCPEEYLDLISCEIMKDPVQLPSSNVILDRSTITRQLLSAEEDPFNRAHLTIDMVVPQTKLKASIEAWVAEKLSQSQNKDGS